MVGLGVFCGVAENHNPNPQFDGVKRSFQSVLKYPVSSAARSIALLPWQERIQVSKWHHSQQGIQTRPANSFLHGDLKLLLLQCKTACHGRIAQVLVSGSPSALVAG
jgi:hypothetical protein